MAKEDRGFKSMDQLKQRVIASKRPKVCSATLSWFVPGVIVTTILRAVAAGMSIAS